MNSGKVKIGLVVILVILISIIAILFLRAKTATIDNSMIAENITVQENSPKYTLKDEEKFVGTWHVTKVVSWDTFEAVPFEAVYLEEGSTDQRLVFNEKNEFINYLYSTDKKANNTGTYALRENQAGKFLLYLEYNDGNIEKLDLEENGDSYTLIMENNTYETLFYLNKN